MPCYPVSSGYSRPSGLKVFMFSLHPDSYTFQRTLFSLAPVICLIPTSPLIIYSDFTSSRKDSILQNLCQAASLHVKWKLLSWVCQTLCDPMDYTVHGILQARILEWVAYLSPEDLPTPGIKPGSPLHCRRIFFFYQPSYQGSPHVNFLWKNFSFSKIFLSFCMISAWWIIHS